MRITQGRGRNRSVIELPHGSIFAAEEKRNPAAYREVVQVVGDIIGVPIAPISQLKAA